MKFINEFDAYLARDHHPDAWVDHAFEDALILLEKFKDSDWEALRLVWSQKDEAWQSRLASILGSENPAVGLKILEDMVFGPRLEIRVQALEQLEVSDDVYRPSPAMMIWLQHALEHDWQHYGKDILQTILSFHALEPVKRVTDSE